MNLSDKNKFDAALGLLYAAHKMLENMSREYIFSLVRKPEKEPSEATILNFYEKQMEDK